MARSRRCCCCNDVYYDGFEGAIYQYHIGGTLSPTQKHALSPHDFLGAVDYRNKHVIYYTIGNQQSTLLYTRTEQLTNSIPIGNAGTFHGDMKGVAVDYVANRVFYAGDRDAGPAKHSFRTVNLDGTGDVEIANESYTAAVDLFYFNTLQYDPINDSVYYVRHRNTNVGVNTSAAIELRGMDSDGTGQNTVCTIDSESPTSTALSCVGNFVVPTLGYTFAVVRYSSTAIKLLAAPLAGGAATVIINTTAATRQLVSPKYCYKDRKIYFFSLLTQPAATPIYNRASYNRINVDGSGEETVFSFADFTGTNRFHFSGFSSGVFLRPGCGFEVTGAQYSGVG